MKILLGLFFILFFSLSNCFALPISIEQKSLAFPKTSVKFEVNGASDTCSFILVNGEKVALSENHFELIPKTKTLLFEIEEASVNVEIRQFPAFLSIIPPLLAILLAFLFKEVLISLFFGLLSGYMIFMYYLDGISSIWHAPFSLLVDVILPSVANPDHVSIIIFSMMIAAMVRILQKNGSMDAVVNSISKFANTRKKGQFITYFLGMGIFFDDYANTLVVGNTMRPVTDKLKISREKLAYIVDSTAAPVAAIAFITTWVGAELSYIESGISQISAIEVSAYSIFLQSLKYSFYPVLTLIFIGILIYSGKEYGPMLQAETNALHSNNNTTESSEADSDKKLAWMGILPIIILLFSTCIGLYITGINNSDGIDHSLFSIIGNADSYTALLWGSFAGMGSAYLLTTIKRKMSLEELSEAIIDGFKIMLTSIVILILAWSLANITEILHTADYLTSILRGNISPFLLPGLIFVISAITAFATGSSWGTMAIIYPLAIPSIWQVSGAAGIEEAQAFELLINGVAGVLAGAVLGDHCSPISDTTILSSMATQCNHISHVKTQIPYALTVGGIALFGGILPSAFGLPLILSYAITGISLVASIYIFGKKVN